jgi:hypothetical protein
MTVYNVFNKYIYWLCILNNKYTKYLREILLGKLLREGGGM